MLQGKGGVGKSFVAVMLAQWYRESGIPVACYDTDPVNRTLSSFKALDAKALDLMTEDRINYHAMDAFVESIMTSATDVVVDNGAASFLPISRYLVESDTATTLAEAGREMVIHTVIASAGGPDDTLVGFLTLTKQFPTNVKIVVWLNEFFGPILSPDGNPFEEMPVYMNHRDRVLGVIRLDGLNPHSFGHNLKQMLDQKMTFAEAVSDPSFFTVAKQRLVMIRRTIFNQMSAVL